MIETSPYMFKPNFIFLLILFFLVVPAKSTSAASGYISDQLIISLRDRTEEPNTIVTRVQTGDRVEIIETKGIFHLVKTEDGQEGWIKKQYLLSSKHTGTLVQKIQSENEALQKQLAQEKKESARNLEDLRKSFKVSNDQGLSNEQVKEVKLLTAQRNELLEKNEALQSSIQSMEEERTQFKENENTIIELNNSRNELREKITQLRDRLDVENQGNTNSLQVIDPRILLLLTGAFILLVGILIGKYGKKRQKSNLSF